MSTFTQQLEAFAGKAKHRADEAVGAIVIGIAARLDERSPVGDGKYWLSPPPAGYVGGHFRANWQLSIGAPSTTEIAGVDPTGRETQGRILEAIPDDAAGKVYFISNNVPYAQRIEEGHSRQAPQGLVGLTLLEFDAIVREAVEKLP